MCKCNRLLGCRNEGEKASFYMFVSLYFSSMADAFVFFGLVQAWLTFFPCYGLARSTGYCLCFWFSKKASSFLLVL